MAEELTPFDARKRLVEVKGLLGNPQAVQEEGASKGIALMHEIIGSVTTYGDQRTRALMAVYAELVKSGGGSV